MVVQSPIWGQFSSVFRRPLIIFQNYLIIVLSILIYIGDTPSLLDEIKKELGGLSEHVHKFAFDIVFAPLRVQLSQVPSMEVGIS